MVDVGRYSVFKQRCASLLFREGDALKKKACKSTFRIVYSPLGYLYDGSVENQSKVRHSALKGKYFLPRSLLLNSIDADSKSDPKKPFDTCNRGRVRCQRLTVS